MSSDSVRSSAREAVLEHIFIGEVLKRLWRDDVHVEFMKPQVDDSGYDLVLEANGFTRHIQLKGTARGSKVADWSIHIALGTKPSGCVLVMQFDQETLDLGPFLFYGGEPGAMLPSIDEFKVARHTKGNSRGEKTLRPQIRKLPRSRFQSMSTIEDVIFALFGITIPPLAVPVTSSSASTSESKRPSALSPDVSR